MKKAIIYLGDFVYDQGNRFARAIGSGLAARGYETQYFDLRDETQARTAFDRGLYRDCDLVFSLNAIRPQADRDGFRYFRDTGCVFFAMFLDPPAWHWQRLAFNNDIVSFIDRSHWRFVCNYLNVPGESVFFPHGGECSVESIPEKKDYELIFTGTWNDPEKFYVQLKNLPDGMRELFMDAIEILLANDGHEAFMVLDSLLRQSGIDVKNQHGIFQLMVKNYIALDSYVRSRKRLDALTALDRAGIAVDIWGNGWAGRNFKNHHLHPPCDALEGNRLMARSRMVLDLGFYPDGAHERIFGAMLNGAAALAMNNAYLRENFIDGQDICLYSMEKPELLPEKVGRCLFDRESLARIAASGREKAELHHTWSARAGRLIELVDEFRKRHDGGK